MYELTCPSCGHSVKSSFVRIGAVVRCAGCEHRFRVAESHVTRQAPVQQPASSSPGDTLLDELDRPPDDDPAEPQSHHQADEHGEVAGLSGLSEALAEATADEEAAAPAPSPPVASGRSRGRKVSRMRRLAQQKARQRSQRTLTHLGIGLVVIILIMSLGVWYMSGPSPTPSDAQGQQNDTDSQNASHTGQRIDQPLPDEPGVVQLQTMRLDAEPWQRPSNTPFSPSFATDQRLSVSNVGMAYGMQGGPPHLVAEVHLNEGAAVDQPTAPQSQAPDEASASPTTAPATQPIAPQSASMVRGRLVLWPRLHLNLVDVMGQVAAKTRVPVGMIHAERPASVRVPVPKDLAEQSLRVDARVKVTRSMGDAIRLEAEGELATHGGRPYMRITVANPTRRAVQRVELAIRATDEQRRPLGQWRATWQGELGAQRRRRFQAPTPLNGQPYQRVANWTVEAVGAPVN